MEISLFSRMTSKTPIPGSLEGVVSTIREDQKLAFLTQSYRLTGNKDYKSEAPLFAVAVLFEGGKGQGNIKKLTQLSLVDCKRPKMSQRLYLRAFCKARKFHF